MRGGVSQEELDELEFERTNLIIECDSKRDKIRAEQRKNRRSQQKFRQKQQTTNLVDLAETQRHPTQTRRPMKKWAEKWERSLRKYAV